MSKEISKNRSKAFKKQSGRCYYCGCHMWQLDVKAFATKYSISVRSAKKLQCTAEHLVAQQDGGSNKQKNIVAACIFCNQTRHKAKKPLDPPSYKTRIQRRLKKGKWHSGPLRRLAL